MRLLAAVIACAALVCVLVVTSDVLSPSSPVVLRDDYRMFGWTLHLTEREHISERERTSAEGNREGERQERGREPEMARRGIYLLKRSKEVLNSGSGKDNKEPDWGHTPIAMHSRYLMSGADKDCYAARQPAVPRQRREGAAQLGSCK
eukprot:932006-Rhodomonas_salina.1